LKGNPLNKYCSNLSSLNFTGITKFYILVTLFVDLPLKYDVIFVLGFEAKTGFLKMLTLNKKL